MFDWLVRAFDWLARLDFIQTLLRWFRRGGPVALVLGAVWAWWWGLPPVLWPFVAVLAVTGLMLVAASFLWLNREIEIRRFRPIANRQAHMMVAAVRAVLEAERKTPKHYVLQAETAHYQIETYPASLVVKAQVPNFMSLHDAMVDAFERTKDGPLAKFARGLNNTPSEILDWYAFAAFERLPIYGKRPPSTKLELIPSELIERRLNFVEGAVELRGTWEAKSEYVELSVKTADYGNFIDYLTKQGEAEGC